MSPIILAILAKSPCQLTEWLEETPSHQVQISMDCSSIGSVILHDKIKANNPYLCLEYFFVPNKSIESIKTTPLFYLPLNSYSFLGEYRDFILVVWGKM